MSAAVMRAVIGTVVAGWLAAQAPCSAAEVRPGEIPEWLRPGAPLRVRIAGPGESRSIIGPYLRHDDSTLCVGSGFTESADSVEIRVERVARLEVSQERGSCAWEGFGVLWLATAAASSAAMIAGNDVSDSGAVVIGVAFYGPLAGLVGSLVGASIPKDRWVLIWDRYPIGR